MSRTVKAYPLVAAEGADPIFDLQVPMGTRLLKITTSTVRRKCWLWAEVVPGAPLRRLFLRAYEAGEELPDGAVYVDTVIGTAVYHVYDLTSATPRR